jgi:hypothetical protein
LEGASKNTAASGSILAFIANFTEPDFITGDTFFAECPEGFLNGTKGEVV